MRTTILFFLLCISASAADTNRVAVVTTNLVEAVPWFRELNGQLYNTQLSTRFKTIDGSVTDVFTNSALIFWQVKRPIYAPPPSDSLVSEGNFLGSSGTPPAPVIVGYKTVEEKNVLILNYSPPELAVGQHISIRAMQIGTTNFNGERIELYDFGLPHKATVTTTNWVQQK